MRRLFVLVICGLLTGCNAAAPAPLPTPRGLPPVLDQLGAFQLARAARLNAERLFAHHDRSGDARLGADEAAALGLDPQALGLLDADGDGALRVSEFLAPERLGALARHFLTIAAAYARETDLDGDGRISAAEYEAGTLAPSPGATVGTPLDNFAARAFARADADRDGALNRHEVVTLISHLLEHGYHLAPTAMGETKPIRE